MTAERILEERARALAAPLHEEQPVETIGVLVVAVGRERYAFGLENVVGIETTFAPTPVPGVPSFWLGVANIHGKVQPILDLGEYLGIGSTVPGGRLVLVTGAGLEVGLVVGDVSEVTWIRRDTIGPPPNVSGRRVVEGVTSDLIAILDMEALLGDPVLAVDDEAE